MFMKHLLRASLVGSSLLLTGLVANAQDRERIVVIEKEYHQTARGDDWWKGHLFQRVRDDLNHIQAVTSPFSADEYRLGFKVNVPKFVDTLLDVIF